MKSEETRKKTLFSSMLLLEEVNDSFSQRNVGGIPLISRRYLQKFKIRLPNKGHSPIPWTPTMWTRLSDPISKTDFTSNTRD
jgi:hypothetical protein